MDVLVQHTDVRYECVQHPIQVQLVDVARLHDVLVAKPFYCLFKLLAEVLLNYLRLKNDGILQCDVLPGRDVVDLLLEIRVQVEVLDRQAHVLGVFANLCQLLLHVVAEHRLLQVLVVDVVPVMDAAQRINNALAVTLAHFQVRVLVVGD